MSDGKRWDVSCPQERDGKTWWTRIGTAFEGKNGTITLHLGALPIGSKVVLMPPRERSGGAPSSSKKDEEDIPF